MKSITRDSEIRLLYLDWITFVAEYYFLQHAVDKVEIGGILVNARQVLEGRNRNVVVFQ